MTMRATGWGLAIGFFVLPLLWAADTMRKDSPSIAPGRYMASIMPGINGDMAKRLEDSVGKVEGVEKVEAHSADSSIHFTIKNDAKVPVTTIQKAVAKVDPDGVMTAPVLEHSLTPNPGL